MLLWADVEICGTADTAVAPDNQLNDGAMNNPR
jgi:hypothetical protein